MNLLLETDPVRAAVVPQPYEEQSCARQLSEALIRSGRITRVLVFTKTPVSTRHSHVIQTSDGWLLSQAFGDAKGVDDQAERARKPQRTDKYLTQGIVHNDDEMLLAVCPHGLLRQVVTQDVARDTAPGSRVFRARAAFVRPRPYEELSNSDILSAGVLEGPTFLSGRVEYRHPAMSSEQPSLSTPRNAFDAWMDLAMPGLEENNWVWSVEIALLASAGSTARTLSSGALETAGLPV